MSERAFAAMMVGSFAIAWLLTSTLIRLAPRIGLLDVPNERKVHTRATPKGGGLAILLALLLSTLPPLLITLNSGDVALAPWVVEFLSVLLGCGSLIALLGLIDDVWPLPWPLRLGVQALASGLILYLWSSLGASPSGSWDLLDGREHLTAIDLRSPLAFGLAILWIAGMVNAFNMLDNMDALSGGVAWISAGSLAVLLRRAPSRLLLGLETENDLFLCLLLPLMGALTGFLWFNRPPARIFMGDCGSTLLGFLLGFTALRVVWSSPRLESALGTILVFAVPLYDMTSVVILRLSQGRSPFHADKQHLSHRLEGMGLSRTKAVLAIHLSALGSGVWGLIVCGVRNPTLAIVLAGVGFSGWLALAVFEFAHRRSRLRPQLSDEHDRVPHEST